jgi:hypothetical protein
MAVLLEKKKGNGLARHAVYWEIWKETNARILTTNL